MNLTKRSNRHLANMVIDHPRWILFICTIITLAAAMLLPKLTRDPTPYLLSKTHPSRVNLEILRENYTGTRDSILVLLEADQTIYNPKTLVRIQKLTAAFEAISTLTPDDLKDFRSQANRLLEPLRSDILAVMDGGLDEHSWEALDLIQGTYLMEDNLDPEAAEFFESLNSRLMPVVEVTSLANTDNILGTSGELDVSPIYEGIPNTPGELTAMQHKVRDNELFKDILISPDGRRTSIIIELAVSDDDTDAQYLIYERVKKILEEKIPGDEKHYIGGLPVTTAAMAKTMQADTARLLPAVFIIVVLCLWVTFRMLKGVVVPLLVVVLSLVITLALKVLLHVPINIVTTALPIFIISIGVADGIHIFSEYRDHLLAGLSKVKALKRTLNHLGMPVTMTSLTTAGAFWSLSITEIVQMKNFGLFVAAGTLVAMFFSLVFIPALLMALPTGKVSQRAKKSPMDKAFTNFLEWLSLAVMQRPVQVIAVTIATVLVGIYGTSRVIVDNDGISYLPDDSDIVISTAKLNQDAAGSLALNLLVTVEKAEPEPFKSPVRLKLLAGLGDYLEAHPLVGKVLGLPQLIERINLVMHAGDPAYDRIPDAIIRMAAPSDEADMVDEIPGRQLISQYLLLYENSGGDTLSDVIDSEYSQANIPLIIKTNSSREIKMLVDDIRLYAKTYFPQEMHIAFSGSANVTMAATFEIVRGQMISLLISFLLILGMLAYTFRSFGKGLFAMIPLGVTVLINFGIMGLAGIPLDIGTAVVSSIVIGIGVDYSIHYLSRLRLSMDRGLPFEEAILETVRHSGKAIASNAFTVGIGFVALLFSAFSPLVTMGWMITTTMFVSAVAAIVIFPATLKAFPALFISGAAVAPQAESVLLLP
jgi:predicted RND superfamily exporter protein